MEQLLVSVEKESQQKEEIRSYEVKVDTLKNSLRREVEKREECERDIIEYKEIENDRNFLKKKYNEALKEVSMLS